jgi:integrase
MPRFVLDALRAHSAAQAKHGLGNAGPAGWVFAGATGGALDMDAFSKRFKLLGESAGLAHLHPHSLRHGFATLSLQAGIDLKLKTELGPLVDPAHRRHLLARRRLGRRRSR